jgi:cyclic pyranopterin phosphate synthase
MPAEIYGDRYAFLPKPELLSFEEIERLASLFVELGVEKLRITGGEPLLRASLPQLIAKLAAIPGLRDLTLTTNGVLLERLAAPLAAAGLRRITVSLDSHDESVFRQLSGGRSTPGAVLAGIEAARRAGLAPIKLNCVVQRGVNDAGIVALARSFKGTGIVLRFIEFMDVGTLNDWNLSQVVSAREILERIDAELPLEPLERSYPGEVASRHRYRDGSGEIGLISSVSQPFCGDCTRARLTMDGKLVTCLFAAGGADLRAPLRAGASDGELRERIASVWHARRDRYSEERAASTDLSGRIRPKLEMYQIGG